MSKAHDWISGMPMFEDDKGLCLLHVETSGALRFLDGRLPSRRVPDLIEWLRDTFLDVDAVSTASSSTDKDANS